LFTVFNIDLEDDMKSDMLKFADDLKVIGKVGSENDVCRLRMDFTRFGSWAEKWQMICNVMKCKVMTIIGFRNSEEDYTMVLHLGIIKEGKDLVLTFVKISRLVNNVLKAVSKDNQVLGMI